MAGQEPGVGAVTVLAILLTLGSVSSAYAEVDPLYSSPSENWQISVTGTSGGQGSVLSKPFSLEALNPSPVWTSKSVDLGASVNLGKHYELGAGAVYVSETPWSYTSNLANAGPRPVGAAISFDLAQDNITGRHDTLALLFQKPLYLYQNSVTMNGLAEDNKTMASDKGHPGWNEQGSEEDIGLAYIRPLDQATSIGFSLTHRTDADDISGVNDYAALFRLIANF